MENEKVFLVGHCNRQYEPFPVPRKIFSTKEKAENYVKEILNTSIPINRDGIYFTLEYPNEYCMIEEAIVQ